MGGFNLQELMSQAKQQYETLQKKMQETVVEGSAGGGTVTVKMDGSKQVLEHQDRSRGSEGGRSGDAAGPDYRGHQRRGPESG